MTGTIRPWPAWTSLVDNPLRALIVHIVARGSSFGATATATSQRLWPASTLITAVVGVAVSAWADLVPINRKAKTIGSRASKATTRRPRTVNLRPELAGAADLAEEIERTAARCTGSAGKGVARAMVFLLDFEEVADRVVYP